MKKRINLKLEYRPSLQMCSLYFESNSEFPFRITLTRVYIRLSFDADGSYINLKFEDDYAIDLTSLEDWNSVKWTKDVSAQECVSTPLYHSGRIRLKLASQPVHERPTRSVEVLPDSIAYQIHCKECDSLVTQENWKFSRVLPLPSENWQSLRDMWFCHKHSDDANENSPEALDSRDASDGKTDTLEGQELSKGSQNVLLPISLQPKLEDLFYSNSKLMLHVTAIAQQSMADVRNRSIVCHNCGGIIGQCASEESIYLYRMKVELKDAKTSSAINPRTPLNLVSKLIREQIAHGGVHCRLILSSESSGDTLLIWMVENDIQIFGAEYCPAHTERREKSIKFEKYHQVLFNCTLRSSPVVRSWSSELTVCSETILQSTLDSLRCHLRRSRELFLKADNEEVHDPSFEIGYIPASPS